MCYSSNAMPSQPNQSLIHGLACLRAVTMSDEPMGTLDLSRMLELNPTRVSRLTGTLADLGLLERTPDRKFRAGPGVHVLATQALHGSGLLAAALPHLLAFRGQGFTVALGVLWRQWVCYLFHERPWQRIEQAIATHRLSPAELSSAGIALLADQDGEPEQLKPVESAQLKILAPGEDFVTAIREARRCGYAVRRYVSGEISIGAVIGRPAVAALAVSCPHLDKRFIPAVAEKLVASALRISRQLHGEATPESSAPPEDDTGDVL